MLHRPTKQPVKKHEPIKVTLDRKIKDGWRFFVIVGTEEDPTRHKVTVDAAYWRLLTKEEETPDELVHRSFEFLLERESRHSILPAFDLHIINRYFPEYETTIQID